MSALSPPGRILCFGTYQCDLSAGELHKNGIKVKISDQPFRLLTILLERPGEVITRQELGEKLWPAGTFVDFEDGLNTAVRKLRAALDDQSENPRFLETIPRRGYRFIAPVEKLTAGNGHLKANIGKFGEAAVGPQEEIEQEKTAQSSSVGRFAISGGMKWTFAGIAALATFTLWWSTPLPPPSVVRVQQITTSSRIDTPVKPVTDSMHVYYIERDGGHWQLMQSPVNGGEEEPIEFPAKSAMVLDVSAREPELLVGSFSSRDALAELWSMPLEGGAAARLGNTSAASAVFSPEGTQIAYIRTKALWMMDAQGNHARKLADLPDGSSWLMWSPDGKRLRFSAGTLFDGLPTSIWEIASDGRNLRQVLPGNAGLTNACCGSWTPDGRYYIFTAYRNGHSNLWALRGKGSWWRRSPRGPFQLTFGPDSPWGGTPARDGRRIFFYNGVWRESLARFDPKTRQLSPLGIDGNATHVSYSRNGQWVAYVDSQTRALFRSRTDGSERIELAPGEMNSAFPRWSPDGKMIAFGGLVSGAQSRTYLVPDAGGAPEPLLKTEQRLRDADWSSDGKSLVGAEESGTQDSKIRRILIVDLATRRSTELPDSADLAMTRWSPDGRFISATTEDQTQLKLWSVAQQKWRTVARGVALGISVWSPDSRYLYFQDLLGAGEPLQRYDVEREMIEPVAEFSAILREGVYRCGLYGLAPDGTPIVGLNRGALDLFAAEVNFP